MDSPIIGAQFPNNRHLTLFGYHYRTISNTNYPRCKEVKKPSRLSAEVVLFGEYFAFISTEEMVRCFPYVTDQKIASYLLVSQALK